MASSARAKDPETLMSPAMMIPDSWRKTDSMAARRSAIYAAGKLRARGDMSFCADGTHFHAAVAASARSGDLRCPFQRFVQIRAVENVVASKLLFGFSKWPIGHHRLAVVQAHRCRRRARFQRFGAAQDAPPRRLRHDFAMRSRDLAHLVGRRFYFLGIDQQHVSHFVSN